MNNEEHKKILSEITDHATKGMKSNLTVKAIKDTIKRYPHDAIARVTLDALLDQLDEQVAEFSSIWWRIREIEKLDAESKANDTDSAEDSAEPITDGEEVTADDLPFCGPYQRLLPTGHGGLRSRAALPCVLQLRQAYPARCASL